MLITDVMKICKIKWLYKDNEFYYCMTDIVTGKDIIIYSSNDEYDEEDDEEDENEEEYDEDEIDIENVACFRERFYETYIQCSKTLDNIIQSVILIGEFEEDVDCIYLNVANLCMFAFVDWICHAGYLELNHRNHTAKMKDTISRKTITVMNCSDECAESLQDFVNFMATNEKVDYSLNGKNTILFMGTNLMYDFEKIQYDNISNDLTFGDLEHLYMELFEYMLYDK